MVWGFLSASTEAAEKTWNLSCQFTCVYYLVSDYPVHKATQLEQQWLTNLINMSAFILWGHWNNRTIYCSGRLYKRLFIIPMWLSSLLLFITETIDKMTTLFSFTCTGWAKYFFNLQFTIDIDREFPHKPLCGDKNWRGYHVSESTVRYMGANIIYVSCAITEGGFWNRPYTTG